uniref:Reductase n=1 Tax=Dulem virus 33 TaxID=3145751 RepID=A0AAU8B7H7_9CAUD
MSDKVDIAIERLKTASKMSLAYYKQPLVVTTSGGKDSSVCVALAQAAGIPFEVMHNHTTADAPETVYFVRDEFKRLESLGIKCTINYPKYKGQRTSMWSLIPQKLFPPTRCMRYCCSVLKEGGGAGRFITTGVRWDESAKRKHNRGIYEAVPSDIRKKIILNNDNDDRRRLFETCTLKATRVCNPIIDWTDEDVWDYIESEHIPVNPLYQCGFPRVGCVGCPLAGRETQQREFAYWPAYQDMYIAAFDRMLKERRRRRAEKSLTTPIRWFDNPALTGLDVFRAWVDDRITPGQMDFDDLEIDEGNN